MDQSCGIDCLWVGWLLPNDGVHPLLCGGSAAPAPENTISGSFTPEPNQSLEMQGPIKHGCMTLPCDSVNPDIREKFNSAFNNAISPALFHRKRHTVYFELDGRFNRASLNLSDVFKWCKLSETVLDFGIPEMLIVELSTPLLNCVAFAHALTNTDACERIEFVNSSREKTAQLHVWTKTSEDSKPTLFGLTIATLYRCTTCHIVPRIVKLKACSRCYHAAGRVRVLYYSKECQLRDYARHKTACNFDWS